MAASPLSFATLISTILDVLEKEPKTYFRQDALCKKVEALTSYKSATIALAIKTLVVSERISGTMKGAKAVNVRYKPPVVSSDEAQAKFDQLMSECAKKIVAMQESCADQVASMQKQLDSVKGNIAEIHLKAPTGKTVKITKGLFHAQFKKILDLATARQNVFIYGPTGCGKSHICHQVAEALNLRFAFVSCTSGMSEGVLGGRLLPVGKSGTFEYVISEFIDCYENGGVFLLDEIDAADPNVLLLVNAALANGHVAVPNRPSKPYAKRHADFVCVAAANTVGTGADRLYSGRNKLDAATLDRFAIGKVLMGYDERVEADLCPDAVLREKLQKYRKAILEHRLERAMSTRFMRDAYKMMTECQWTMADIDEAFFSGWRADEINKVKGF